jgi:hypothetical protein
MDDPLARGNGHGNAGRAAGRDPVGPAHDLSYPDGSPRIRDLIMDLLDEAHAALSTQDLAALLLAVRRMTGPANGLLPTPASAPRASLGRAPAGYLGPITRALAAGSGMDGVAGWLEAYLDDVAARPRGSALPKAA